jgi:glycosyltransferase involved in cell wall biosynthesis
MKVVHLASAGELGGAELVVLDILAGLREAKPGWTLELIVPAPGPLQDRASQLGVTVRVLEWGPALERLGDAFAGRRHLVRLSVRMLLAIPAVIAYAIKLRAELRAAGAAIVHTHGSKMNLLGMWIRSPGVPLVIHLHDYITRRPIVSRLMRLRRRGTTVGAAISRSIAEDAARALGEAIPLAIVYNGIDTANWSADGPVLDLDAVSGLPPASPGTVRVGLVATLARWKGHDIFLEALMHLRTIAPVRGYIIGGSIYRTDRSQLTLDELRATASRLGIASSVGFTGFVSDAAAAMRGLDIVVHASTLPEPFGRVVVEGMATERAVISTATGGAAELIEPEQSAVAVPPGDSAALATAIGRLADDPDRRRRLGTNGRARVERLFDRTVMTSAIVDLYESIHAQPDSLS